MKKEKIKVDKQDVELSLDNFKGMYEPKNKIIDGIILKRQNELNKCKALQVVFIEKVTLGVKCLKRWIHLQRQMIVFLLGIYLIAGMNGKYFISF